MDRAAPIEVAALDEEYKAQVQLLFSKLVDALSIFPMGANLEQDIIDRFTRGIGVVRRAREIALEQIGKGTNA